MRTFAGLFTVVPGSEGIIGRRISPAEILIDLCSIVGLEKILIDVKVGALS